MSSPWSPSPTYGRELLASIPEALLRRPIVLTQPEPWALVERQLAGSRLQRQLVTTMEHEAVRQRTDDFGPATAVLGIGGGSALDHAKYTAWRLGLPLILMPSILSVDAAYTRAVGVREGGRVRYVGDARPEHLLVDFDLLEAAPPLLNRAGAGDILSIFTALWDWRAASERLGERHDAAIAVQARAVLDRLLDGADELGRVSEAGLRLLSELYVAEVRLCERVGSSRPEEGSEHYLAYALEAATGRHYVHGQLIGLCVLLAGLRQAQDVDPIARALRALRLDCTWAAVGTSRPELRQILLDMHRFVASEPALLPGVFHLTPPVTAREADELLDAVEHLTSPG